MKTVYQIPALRIVEMAMQDSLLLSTSGTEVEGANGGWVKEDVVTTQNKGYNVWDDNWSE